MALDSDFHRGLLLFVLYPFNVRSTYQALTDEQDTVYLLN
jgi:hypothetical protein